MDPTTHCTPESATPPMSYVLPINPNFHGSIPLSSTPYIPNPSFGFDPRFESLFTGADFCAPAFQLPVYGQIGLPSHHPSPDQLSLSSARMAAPFFMPVLFNQHAGPQGVSFQDLLRSVSSPICVGQQAVHNNISTFQACSSSKDCSDNDKSITENASPADILNNCCTDNTDNAQHCQESDYRSNSNDFLADCGANEINQEDINLEGQNEDSGYWSSDSSVYAVDSDDENYGPSASDACNLANGEKTPDGQCNDDDCFNNGDRNIGSGVASQEEATDGNCGSGQAEATNGGSAEPTDYCSCITGNPFIHIMTADALEILEETKWKRRNRTKKGEKRPDCRIPKGIGAIEIALRTAPFRKGKFIFEPIVGLTFDSENEAYDFYNMYSFEAGFGIKKDNTRSNNSDYQTLREFRCLCSGTDPRCEYKSKKTGCKAMLRLHRTSDYGWYVSCHISEHNHPLTETCGETKQWFSHKRIDPYSKDMIRYLRENNVSFAKVRCIMGSLFGSMESVPISKRSLKNICQQIAKDQMDDDIQKTLRAFRKMRSEDPGFQFAVDVDDEKRIKTLLWINGKSRDQYKNFGDAITFDTTYCTNIYKMPFGLFVGVNNHFQSVIFGGVFMKDETIQSFEFVFTEFVSLMGGKAPQTVLTDQCKSMKSALANVWKETKHVWCKWHVFKDAKSKLGPIYKRGSAFRKEFHRIINEMMTIPEFEKAWDQMLVRFKLKKNEYLSALYNKRDKWAKPYLRGVFCARMSSTQRSESANHMLKRFVPRNCSMNRFIEQFNKLLFDRNEEEDRAEFDTKISRNVRRREWPIEEHAMKFYTAATYQLFRREIDKSTYFFAVEIEKNEKFEVIHVKSSSRMSWSQDKYIVSIQDGGKVYDCQCGLYEHFGMLCCHVLRVMVQQGISEVPSAHIMKRWTRDARDILPAELKVYQRDTIALNSMTFRHSFLLYNGMKNINDGNKDLNAFSIVAKYQKKAEKKLAEYFRQKEASCDNGSKRCRARNCNMDFPNTASYYTSESDANADTDTDAEPVIANTYGAAGSCSGMSDSELLQLRAPSFKRPSGRPRASRFKGSTDVFHLNKRKRTSKTKGFGVDNFSNTNNEENGRQRKKSRCSGCQLLGHNVKNCKNKTVDESAEIPDF